MKKLCIDMDLHISVCEELKDTGSGEPTMIGHFDVPKEILQDIVRQVADVVGDEEYTNIKCNVIRSEIVDF